MTTQLQWEIECIRREQGEDAPITLTLYHGTTHAFDAFRPERVNDENMFGRQFYFTSSEWDAEKNYAHEDGPDLKQRIELTAERLFDYGEEDYEDEDAAKRAAREMFYGGRDAVLTVEVTLNKPIILGTAQPHLIVKDYDETYAAAVDRVAQEEGVEPNEIFESDELHAQVNEVCEEMYEADLEAFTDHVERALDTLKMSRADADADMQIFSLLRENASIDDVFGALEKEPYVYLYEDETGLHNVRPVITQILHQIGYDAIVLLDASAKCSNMEMEPETAHIALCVDCADQVKVLERRELGISYDMAM